MTRKVTFEIEAENNTDDAFDQVEENLGGSGDAAESSGLQFTELNSIMEVGNKVFAVAKQAYSALIQPTIDLGLATSRLSGSMGISTEEASTMIQMFEDFGLSQEETTTAMEAAVKRGYAPTIDGLASMADELVSIQDPVKQGALLFEVFGKKGQDVGKLMREGGAGVRAAAEDVSALGLAMTQDQVDDILAYRQSLNDLGDVWALVGMSITKNFIPPITEAMIALGDLFTIQTRFADGATKTGERVAIEGKSYEYYQDSILDIARANGMLTVAQRKMIEEFDRSGPSWRVSANDYQILTSRIGLMTRATYDAVPAQVALTAEQQKAAQEAAAQMEIQIQAAKDLGEAVGAGLTGSIQKATEAQDATKESIEAATQALMNQTLMAGLDAGQQLEVGRALGIVSEADYAAVKAAQALKKEYEEGKISAEEMAAKTGYLADMIARLQSKDITITTRHVEIFENVLSGSVWNGIMGPGAGVIGDEGATGINSGIVPAGFNRDNFLVGMSSGERYNVTPASRVGASGNGDNQGGGNTYEFHAHGIEDVDEFLALCGEKVRLHGGAF